MRRTVRSVGLCQIARPDMIQLQHGCFSQFPGVCDMECDFFFLRCPENGAKPCGRRLCVFPRSYRFVIRSQQQRCLACFSYAEFQVEVIPLLFNGSGSLFAIRFFLLIRSIPSDYRLLSIFGGVCSERTDASDIRHPKWVKKTAKTGFSACFFPILRYNTDWMKKRAQR